MSTQLPENGDVLVEVEEEKGKGREKRRRWWLVALFLLLLLLLCGVVWLFVRYLGQPAPLPDLLALPVDVNIAPHYLFSIYGMDRPVGVAVYPRGDRIYVAETGRERLIKMFDRDGNPLHAFAPPRTRSSERSPVYLATDSIGRLYVTDRLQHALFVYDSAGTYLDTVLAPDLTLSEYISKHTDHLDAGATFAYNSFEAHVYYQEPGQTEQTLPAPITAAAWSPLGVRMDGTDRLLLTDVVQDRHTIREIASNVIAADSWREFGPAGRTFGAYGQGDGEFLFPNVAVTDSRGRVYVTDGNNGRISVWDANGEFLFHFGQGSGEGALGLPRGAAIDAKDRLHIVDAVGQNVKVYDVSGQEPNFLFAFGELGRGDGQFWYPNDIALDITGRLYIVDRENDRIQVWSY